MYNLLKPLIFRMPPETAHNQVLALLRLAGSNPLGRFLVRALFQPAQTGPEVKAFGLTFNNPIGLAAGYDKDGLGWRGLAELGFGHIEIGTVTTLPQAGNPVPRVFRLVDDSAIINRMGFPSQGSRFVAKRLSGKHPKGLILGVNIGKHGTTPLSAAAEDYLTLMEIFAPLADYLAINVSSPNTPGLRTLQARQPLQQLLVQLTAKRQQLNHLLGKPTPLLIKLSPDLSDAELDQALDVILSTRLDGIIVSNTTLLRPPSLFSHSAEDGGLSGQPISQLNTRLIQRITRLTEGKIPIVGSGGIMKPDDAKEKLDAGARLVQIYSGLIYAGPGLVRSISKEILSSKVGVNSPPAPFPVPQTLSRTS